VKPTPPTERARNWRKLSRLRSADLTDAEVDYVFGRCIEAADRRERRDSERHQLQFTDPQQWFDTLPPLKGTR